MEKLKSEGLFDENHKKEIPRYPEKIAVITSPTGAAVQDILNVITRRYPCAELIMCPVLVQGDGASAQLIDAVKKVNEAKCADVIIIGRGGGSIEDLWAFNDEGLAREIYASKIPVISAVGHEIDFTICDFVSDLRAPTPSAGAELAVPDINDMKYVMSSIENALVSAYNGRINDMLTRLTMASNSYVLKNPANYIRQLSDRLNGNVYKLSNSYSALLSEQKQSFASMRGKLDAISPLATIARGYSIALSNGKPIKSKSQLKAGDNIDLKMSDGTVKCSVDSII